MLTEECLDGLCATAKCDSVDRALEAVRALRNSCAGNLQNAEYLVRCDIIQWIAMFCRDIALMNSNFSDEDSANRCCNNPKNPGVSDDKTRGLLVLALCQFLSNFSACGECPSQLLWSPSFGEHGFRDVLAAAATVRSRKATAAVISTVYNSIKQIEHACRTERSNVGTSKLCSSRGLSSQLLLAATPTMLDLMGSKADSSASSNAKPAVTQPPSVDPVLEWLHILFYHLLKSRGSSLNRMFLTLQPRACGDSVWDFDMAALESSIPLGELELTSAAYVLEGGAGMKGAVEVDSAKAVLTHEQIILLQIVLTIFEDPSSSEDLQRIDYCSSKTRDFSADGGDAEVHDAENENSDRDRGAVPLKAVTEDLLVSVAEATCELYWRIYGERMGSDNDNSGGADSSCNGTSNSGMRDNENDQGVLLLCLNVLGAGLSYPPRDLGSRLRNRVASSGIINTCCLLLKRNEERKAAFMARKVKDREEKAKRLSRIEKEQEKEKEKEKEKEVPPSSSSNKTEGNADETSKSREHPDALMEEEEETEGDIVKSALQVIGNLAYGCHAVQDLMRTSGGLSLCLSHCATDFRLPFAREWGLFCVRNICEGNRENQTFISELQPHKVEHDEYLESLGVKVQIDPQSGKISATSTGLSNVTHSQSTSVSATSSSTLSDVT